MPWTLARRTSRMNASAIRELLKLTERPGVISLAGGLPSPEGFPLDALREASARVWRDQPREALQYAPSEGYAPLREWVAAELQTRGLRAQASQVLVTTGSQQGLDLAGKVLIDPGMAVATESPTYLGALQAFAPYEPTWQILSRDEQGPTVQTLQAAREARLAYLVPSFQNPTGSTIDSVRRAELARAAECLGMPIVEDDPYGELWYDTPPPASIASHWPEGTIYLGSFSKVLAPGLRLGYLVAPQRVFPRLLQAKQAADLHSPGLNQRIVYEAVRHGMLERHLPVLREHYRKRRDAMQAALVQHLPPECRWTRPQGGMFFWITLPEHVDATALLPQALQAGVAYVPGAAFHPAATRHHTLRLSFATVAPSSIEAGIEILSRVLGQAQPSANELAIGQEITP